MFIANEINEQLQILIDRPNDAETIESIEKIANLLNFIIGRNNLICCDVCHKIFAEEDISIRTESQRNKGLNNVCIICELLEDEEINRLLEENI